MCGLRIEISFKNLFRGCPMVMSFDDLLGRLRKVNGRTKLYYFIDIVLKDVRSDLSIT